MPKTSPVAGFLTVIVEPGSPLPFTVYPLPESPVTLSTVGAFGAVVSVLDDGSLTTKVWVTFAYPSAE